MTYRGPYTRVPNWWEFESTSGGFNTRLARYHALNFTRCFAAIAGQGGSPHLP